MTVIVRDIVELYKTVKCEKKLHREILVFSISHDHSSIRIYDHYFLINEDKITFHRHSIHKFNFTTLNDKEKWTIYKFTKNVYDVFMSKHLKRICSVINKLSTDINFKISQFELRFRDDFEL